MNPRLLVITGPHARATCPITDDPFSIGRDPQNHLSVPDPSVSREHCVLVRRGDGFIIRDLDSHNGTLVNDLPVNDQLLAHRDYITIGGTVPQFLTGDDVVFEDPADFATVSLPADPSSPLPAQLATADLHALLRVQHHAALLSCHVQGARFVGPAHAGAAFVIAYPGGHSRDPWGDSIL
jgi:hypothetical protein